MNFLFVWMPPLAGRMVPHGNENRDLQTWVIDTEIPANVLNGKAWTAYRFENLIVPTRCPPGGNPFLSRRTGLRRFLATARRLAPVTTQGRGTCNVEAVAAKEGISAIRIRQFLRLLRLAPEILADLEDPENNGPVPTEAELMKLVSVSPVSKQIAEFKRAVEMLKDWGY